jgi:hypothetical protein
MRQGRTGPHRHGDEDLEGIRSQSLQDPNLIRPAALAWRVSSRCAGNGSCTEVTQLPMGRIAIRDGMNPRPDQVMVFTQEQWMGFLARVKADQAGPR